MLLQRLRTAEPTVEAAIVYNLVDLAIISPRNTFVDIIRTFSSINRSGNRDDPRFSSNTVCSCNKYYLTAPLTVVTAGYSSSDEASSRAQKTT